MTKKHRTLISILLIIVTSIFALNYYSLKENKSDSLLENFSPTRVASDIKVISAEPHSIEHPLQRNRVREYLSERLKQMQIESVCYSYDSVLSRFNKPMTVKDLYARIEPLDSNADAYLLLVAHYDSRFKTKVLDKEVYSFGAADDGYGLGVILESVRLALLYRDQWKQGIKILFTDTEESDLEGMKCALKENPEIFDKVGLVINVEARGVKGPSMLFETSPGNEKLTDLYKYAGYPFSYSLTSAVYEILPNSTDYSLLKDKYPGMNFSVIGNLKYYHTNLDNYNNISLGSIKHYGMQIKPIIYRYLVSSAYSDSRSLVSNRKNVFLTVPFFGLVVFTKAGYLLLNVFSILILLGLFFWLKSKDKVVWKSVFRGTSLSLLFLILSIVSGLGISWLSAYFTGQKFNLVSLPYVKNDWIIIISTIFFVSSMYLLTYMRGIQKNKFSHLDVLIGNIALQMFFSVVLYILTGENFFTLIPCLMALCSIFFAILTKCGFMYNVSIIAILLLILPFNFVLALALTIGSLSVIMLVFIMLISLLVPLAGCYARKLF